MNSIIKFKSFTNFKGEADYIIEHFDISKTIELINEFAKENIKFINFQMINHENGYGCILVWYEELNI